jgi:uncharacterized protein
MKILVAGGTGFLGRPLCATLVEEGHQVVVLSRHPSGARSTVRNGVEVLAWDPTHAQPDAAWVQAVGASDAVINLAGENVGGRGPLPQRWTTEIKNNLWWSRLESTRAIVEAIAASPAGQRPRVLLNASAIGYYGNRGDEILIEGSPPGSDFFAELCADWEAEARSAEQLGVRVVRLRTGVVLDHGTMATDLLLLASQLGAGGRLGSGRQWWSWIHRADVIGLMLHALQTDALGGELNVVAPAPRRMIDFPRILGHLLRRPSWLPTPAFGLRLVLGEIADVLLLSSQRVLPVRAMDSGYHFQFPELEDALESIVGARARRSSWQPQVVDRLQHTRTAPTGSDDGHQMPRSKPDGIVTVHGDHGAPSN